MARYTMVYTSRPWLSVSGSELCNFCPFDFVSPLQITLSRFSSFSKGSDGSLTEHFHLRYIINKKKIYLGRICYPNTQGEVVIYNPVTFPDINLNKFSFWRISPKKMDSPYNSVLNEVGGCYFTQLQINQKDQAYIL